jgi:signal transduction histidine kinase
MTEIVEAPAADQRLFVHWNFESQTLRLPILRYGFSIFSVAIALALSLIVQYLQFRDVALPLFTLAIALTTWYAGNGPSALSVALATLCFDYFFTEPLYTLYISTSDLPYFFIFLVWAVIVASFSSVRRRIEDNLCQAREELARRADDLEAANKELEAFAYSVSHDLRAPLRHITGYAELLHKHASSSLDDRSNRHLKILLESSKRMGNLIDDLLAFSRIGRAETRKTSVNLAQLVREVVAELGQDSGGREIAWKIGPLPVCYGDRSMLRLVAVNLLSNAIKFTRIRQRAEIEIGSTAPKDEQIEVFVRDNGAGFEMQYVDKLFGVFQRLHRLEEFEGTGIGLATVQRIIQRHGGKVRAEGGVDRGATFYFSLPRTQIDNREGTIYGQAGAHSDCRG